MKKNIIFKNIRYYFIAALLSLSILMPSVNADNEDKSELKLSDIYNSNREFIWEEGAVAEDRYVDVISRLEDAGYCDTEGLSLKFGTLDARSEAGKEIEIKNSYEGKEYPVIYFDENYEWIEWEIEIDKSGFYNIGFEYFTLQGGGGSPIRSIEIDGEIPYKEANNFVLYKRWKDEGEPLINNIGDEIAPSQEEIPGWRVQYVKDSEGFVIEPLKFYLEKGEHVIRLYYVRYPVVIGNLCVESPGDIIPYNEVLNMYKNKGYKESGSYVKIQAESSVAEKNDSVIRMVSATDPATEPFKAGYQVLNCIGGSRWAKGQQSVTFKFETKESGLYKISLRAYSAGNIGLPSYRKIEIDGNVPFEELLKYKFEYSNDWQIITLSGENGEPYLFYLEKGVHTLTMTVNSGDYAPLIYMMEDMAADISKLGRQVIMIMGSDPDPNYDYEIEKKIPEFTDKLEGIVTGLNKYIDILKSIGKGSINAVNSLIQTKEPLERIISDIELSNSNPNAVSNAMWDISGWASAFSYQPLMVDYITVSEPGMKIEEKKVGIFKKLKITWQNFMLSFRKDYDSVGGFKTGNEEDAREVKVWIGYASEWGSLINRLAEDTLPGNIRLKMNVLLTGALNSGGAVNTLIMNLASGTAPDVVLGLPATSPVEYAIRDAAVNLREFDDFDDIEKRFSESNFIPLEYEEGIYGLPERIDFKVLFYRKDILEELGLFIPDTWEEIYEYILPVLNQNNLQMNFPSKGSGYGILLFQNGGNFYTKDGYKSTLDTPEAYKAFVEYTEMFTLYGIPVSANFYYRFRTGQIPIGIGGYGDYIRLLEGAPEIAGRWGIALLPGTVGKNGEISRQSNGFINSAAMILSDANEPNAAWEFLKWWTSSDIQVKFGNEIEAIVGPQARWNSANIEALKGLPWNDGHLKTVLTQLSYAREMPVVLGGYYTSRNVEYAWNRVVLENMIPRDSLEKAVKDINRELRVKQEEYGVFID